jgi:hypothetical protein
MHKTAHYWIEKLPDFNLGKYQAFAVSDIKDLLEQQKSFVRQWMAICELYGLTMHFILSYSKDKPNGKRLDAGLALRGEDADVNAVEALLFASSLKDYYTFKKDDGKARELSKHTFSYKAAMTKNVRKLPPPQGTNPFWFVPEWEINDEARLIELVKTMESRGEDSAYRVDMYPGNFVDSTREAFKNSMDSIRRMLGYREDSWTRILNNGAHEPRSQNAEEALRQFEDWIEKIETSPHLYANIYAFSNSARTSELLLHSAGSEVLQKGKYTVLPLKSGSSTTMFDDLGPVMNCAKDDAFPEKLRFWAASYTFEEIAALAKFPALYEGEVIQLPKETAADLGVAGLPLGKDASGHQVNFPLDKLTKHAFICGVPGGGKTNTMLHLTSTLWKKYGVPFLVFEPAKKEYRALFNDPGMKDVMLFSPNAGTLLPIAINPFEFPLGLTLSEHIAALMQVFSGAFEVSGPVWYYLNYAIENAYYALGWKAGTINEGALDYPMLSDIIQIYRQGVESSSYDGELKGNLTSFLQVRLGGLMTRELDEMFNISQSTLRPEDWLKTPAVIELEALEQGACNFFILLLCTLIRETLKVSPHAETEHGLRHVIFIEEAHNLISPQTEQQSQEMVNPKISATAYIVKMLAEVRALKEGIVIADQLPSAIASEVMKNTGLKIVHRMTAEDDRNMVGSTMSATETQLEHVGTYQPGDALVFYEGLQLPFRGKIEEWEKGKFEKSKPLDNAELARLTMESPKYRAAMENTVNGLILKLYITHITKIDDSLLYVSNEKFALNESLDEIEADAENNGHSEQLSEIRQEFEELCDIMSSCKTSCIDLRDSIENMRTRFSAFGARFDKVGKVYVQKFERYNEIFRSLMELQRRIRERV